MSDNALGSVPRLHRINRTLSLSLSVFSSSLSAGWTTLYWRHLPESCDATLRG
ncbi:hypothetical protein N8473_01340 [Amylibacter sp.]|nr:hypothetical protein [Amylibacter sp.]MDC1531325.1 hypothetical protein [Amylibacter sp.]